MRNTIYSVILTGMAFLATNAWGQSSGHGWPTFNCAVNDTYKDVDSGLAWLCGPTANTWKPNPQYQPWGTGGNSSSITLENVYSAPGSFTFAHNLSDLSYQIHCITRSGSGYAPATYTDYPVDANNVSVTVPSAGDYICAFSTVTAQVADFLIATSPTSLLYEPTMTGTQTPAFTVNQTAVAGYSGTANYTSSGLASGMTGAFSPTSITGTGSNVLTLSFPASQTPATTAFTVTGTDGSKIHTASPSITVGNINSGLVECWAMTDGSGSAFADSCATSNTETLVTGTLTWGTNTGFPGLSPTFSATAYTTGANQTATNFDGTTPFSVSAWTTLPGATSTRLNTLASSLNPSASFKGWEVSMFGQSNNTSYHLEWFLVNTFPSNAMTVETSVNISSAAQHFVVVTYDGSRTAAGVKMYVDGASVGTTIDSDVLTATSANTLPVSIGARPNGTDPINGGIMSSLRIYNRVLSSTDVSNYYSAGAR